MPINFRKSPIQRSVEKTRRKIKKEVYHRSEREFEKLKTIPATNLERASAKRLTTKRGARRSFTLPPQPASRLEKRTELDRSGRTRIGFTAWGLCDYANQRRETRKLEIRESQMS